MYILFCVFCFIVLFCVLFYVEMCNVLLPLGVNRIAVNKYIISYHIIFVFGNHCCPVTSCTYLKVAPFHFFSSRVFLHFQMVWSAVTVV